MFDANVNLDTQVSILETIYTYFFIYVYLIFVHQIYVCLYVSDIFRRSKTSQNFTKAKKQEGHCENTDNE